MATSQALDFTNVKEGGQFNKLRQPAGDYLGTVLKVADAVKKDDKSKKMWLFTIKVGPGTYPYYCAFEENQLWKIRNLFVAAGIGVPKKRVKVDPNKVVGKTIGVTLEDDEYEGKAQSVINATMPASEVEGSGDSEADDEEGDDEESGDDTEADDDADDEEEPAPAPKAKKAKPAPAASDDEDDDLEELDIEDI